MKKTFLFIAFLLSFTFVINANAEDYQVQEGAVYYETSLSQGKQKTVNDLNQYINSDRNVIINGWAIISQGKVVDSLYDNYTKDSISLPDVEDGQSLMLHINSTIGYQLGWIDADKIGSTIDDSKETINQKWNDKTTYYEKEEFVKRATDVINEQMKIDQSKNMESVVVFDVSGSMSRYMEMVQRNLNEVYSKVFYAFAEETTEKMSTISEEFWKKEYFNIGGATDCCEPLEKVSEENPNCHIYFLSDLENNIGIWKEDSYNFSGKITLVVYGDGDQYFYERIIKHFPDATINLAP